MCVFVCSVGPVMSDVLLPMDYGHQVPLFMGFTVSILEWIVIFSSGIYTCTLLQTIGIWGVFYIWKQQRQRASLYPYKGALGSTLPGKYLEKVIL